LDVSHSSNAKERGIKVEIKKKYLPNYGRYSEKLAEVKRPSPTNFALQQSSK
jgi:hypothetical protein